MQDGSDKKRLSDAKRALLAQRIQAARQRTSGTSIPARPADAPLVASFGQERLWFLHQLHPESAAYNMYAHLHLRGPLDVEVLRRAFAEVVVRHEVLRTNFTMMAGQLLASAASSAPPDLPLTDLSADPREHRDEAVRQHTERHTRQPFDLSQEPPFRAALLRLSEDEHILLLTLHHIITDEWSFEVLRDELAALYTASLEGRPAPLPPLPLQYADFAHWQRRRWEEGALREHLAYWREHLAEPLPVLPLPTDHPRPLRPSPEGAFVERALPPERVARLRALGQEAGATTFMMYLAVFYVLLYRYTARTDLIVGTPVTSRGRAELGGLVGFFLNTLVLRLKLSGELSFREVLRRVRQVSLDGLTHQALPFEKLVEALQPARRPGKTRFSR